MKKTVTGLVYRNEMLQQETASLDLPDVSDFPDASGSSVVSCHSNNLILLPGFADVHVHFREPGFSYKETILTGCRAAAAGGYTAVCTMPNLSPPPDNREHLLLQLQRIRHDASIAVYPYGTITMGQGGEVLSDMEGLCSQVVAFSDDGRGVQSAEVMEAAMREAKRLGKIIVAHAEDNRLLFGGYIHQGAYALAHGHRGISSESEWVPIERDIALVRKTGAAYHVCHVSTKESVAIIRQAKSEGLDVTCETAPHYLTLSENDLQEDGRFKMNPPLRSAEDREALILGLCDGTIDMIATDHAPHAAEEKNRGLEKSAMGVVGLETAFPVLYTALVKTKIISMEMLVSLMAVNPRKRFGLPFDVRDFTVFDLGASYEIDPGQFQSKGRATPFAGRTVYGKCLTTEYGGKKVW